MRPAEPLAAPPSATPLVSVIIPVHNGEAYLGEAVASVRRQSGAALEIVVVDDGSTDGSAAMAGGLGADVRLIRQPRAGVTVARNRGLGSARGDLIAFLDCDDVWTDDKLATHVPILLEHPDIAVIVGHTRRMWTTPDGITHLTGPELALHLGAALIRRSAFGTIGLFDEILTHCEDWDWFMRARECGIQVVVHPEVALLYRRHGGNISNQWSVGTAAFARMIRKSIDRRRSGGPGVASLPDLPSLDQYLRERATRAGAVPRA
jgi:glycosyltransferase involved in cell wall biosynthesis